MRPKRSLSLVIVTYRREQELLDSLRSLESQGPVFDEVIVVDNGRSEELKASAEQMFDGRCKVLQPESNLGAVGRSAGINASHGDIVVTLDDDVQLLDATQLQGMADVFAGAASVGCVNFKIVYSDSRTLDLSDWCHPRAPHIYQNQLFDTAYISEGACAFDGPLVRRLGAYPSDLHIGQEGVELAARILDAGYGIYYLPTVCVGHSVAEAGRTPGRQFYYNARNIYWIALRCYPLGLAMRTVAREWAMLFLMALMRARLGYFLRGCRDGVSRSRELWARRDPIGANAAYRIRHLNRLKPSLLERFIRVFRSRTLT